MVRTTFENFPKKFRVEKTGIEIFDFSHIFERVKRSSNVRYIRKLAILAEKNELLWRKLSKNCLCLIFVPTFDTKVTEYLCSGWVFFLQTNFDFLTSHF